MNTTPRSRGLRLLAVLLAGALFAAACGDDADTDADADATSGSGETASGADAAFPVSVDNCDVEVVLEAAPTAAVTMNQPATEVMLTLGLGEHLAGTAYLDDEIHPDLADAYAEVPVIADEYPSQEALLDAEPDFVYASYVSAFGDEAAGSRASLADLGIGSYLSPAYCPDFRESGEMLTFEMVFQELLDIGELFGVGDDARALVAEQQAMLDGAAIDGGGDITVMWWDSGFDVPLVGACCGSPALMMQSLGVENIFADVDGGWADGSWEVVADVDPDVIVLVDASWDPVEDKQEFLANDPTMSNLTAVRNGNVVVIPYSATSPGVRMAPGLLELADAIRALDLDAS